MHILKTVVLDYRLDITRNASLCSIESAVADGQTAALVYFKINQTARKQASTVSQTDAVTGETE